MEKTKKLISVLAIVMIVIVGLTGIVPVQASSKAVSKKTITISLDEKTPTKICWIKAKNTDSELVLSVKIKKLKGKPTEETIPYLCTLDYENGKGSLFYDLKASKFKKGKLKLSESSVIGDGSIRFEMPEGVTSVTYEVTVKVKDNKKNIMYVKQTKRTEPKNYNFGEH